MLQKRKADQKARTMVTMSGTTVIDDRDGSRRFTEAVWTPTAAPNAISTIPAAAYAGHPAVPPALLTAMISPRRENRMSQMSGLSQMSPMSQLSLMQAATSEYYSNIYQNGLEAERQALAAAAAAAGPGASPISPPRAVKRASYMSAKRLEIPGVLREDYDAEVAACEEYAAGSGSGSSSTLCTGPNVSAVTVVSEKEKGVGAVYSFDVASSSQGSGFGEDVDLERMMKGEGDAGKMV